MSEQDLIQYLQLSESACRRVGDFLLERWGGIKVQHRKDEHGHFGIEEDDIAHNMYDEFARSTGIVLYSEEGDQKMGEGLTWVVDPIEGTNNYRGGHDYWATQICLLQNNRPVVACVYRPCTKDMFTAVVGKGTSLNGHSVRVSDESDLKASLLSTEKGTGDIKEMFLEYFSKMAFLVKSVRMPGATGLDMAYVSKGVFDCYVGLGSQAYDYAAGTLIVAEAGGVVKTIAGGEWNMDERWIVCGNAMLVNELLENLE